MNKKEKVKKIIQILNKYIPNPKIALHHKDPYTLLIATILSARCTDKKVNEITPLLFAKAGSPQKMAKLSSKQILTIIKKLGLAPQKSKAIKKLSKILVEKYKGKVPKTFEELEELPGVGHKTASVVMGNAFNIPAFPVDTHVFRLAKRWGLSNSKNVEGVEKDLKKLFNKKLWNRMHLQLILFGRQYCKAISHKKENCPLCNEIL